MKMSVTVDFVKGHCGWDVMTLLPEGQVSPADELAASLKILSAPMEGGLEVGWLGVGTRPGELRLRMVNSTIRSWIPMCGGMTQVIGKAVVETFFRDLFRIDTTQTSVTIILNTPAGAIPVRTEIVDGRATSVTTTMDNYLIDVYRLGIEPLLLQGVPLLRVGKYAVIDIAALEKTHPGVDFTRRDFGPPLEIVNDVLRAFRKRLGVSGVNGMLYDERPEGAGQFRVFPRFFSDDLGAARIPWEFQCGTGSIVVAITLAREGKLPFAGPAGTVLFEWGSHRTTPDPYGIRISRLHLDQLDGHLIKADFSHSVVEILAEGRLTLPGY